MRKVVFAIAGAALLLGAPAFAQTGTQPNTAGSSGVAAPGLNKSTTDDTMNRTSSGVAAPGRNKSTNDTTGTVTRTPSGVAAPGLNKESSGTVGGSKK